VPLEQVLLHHPIDGGDQNDKAGMQRLRGIELPKVARVVGDEDKIAVACVAHDVPVLPARSADMRDVLSFMAGFPGDGDQVDAEAFVDQNLTTPRWCRAVVGRGVPAADRAMAACAGGRAADRQRRRRARAGSSRP
jgi:hypothetical protein